MDTVIKNMLPNLSPGKGYHFPNNPYVEYVGNMTDKTTLRQDIEIAVNKLVNADLPVSVYDDCDEDKIMELCGHIPDYIRGMVWGLMMMMTISNTSELLEWQMLRVHVVVLM